MIFIFHCLTFHIKKKRNGNWFFLKMSNWENLKVFLCGRTREDFHSELHVSHGHRFPCLTTRRLSRPEEEEACEGPRHLHRYRKSVQFRTGVGTRPFCVSLSLRLREVATWPFSTTSLFNRWLEKPLLLVTGMFVCHPVEFSLRLLCPEV